MDKCIFCKISSGDAPSSKIYESDNFLVIYTIDPICEGHSLIISKKHFKNILDLPSILGEELVYVIKQSSLILMKKFDCRGFNLVQNNFSVAEQIIEHFHIHLIPRKEKDGIKVLG